MGRHDGHILCVYKFISGINKMCNHREIRYKCMSSKNNSLYMAVYTGQKYMNFIGLMQSLSTRCANSVSIAKRHV